MRGINSVQMGLWILVGVAIGVFCTGFYFVSSVTPFGTNNCAKQYPLTSQKLDCATYDDSSQRLKVVDDAIDSATALYLQEGKVTRMSVWVRGLESGQSASNNENQRYAPASLLKLPLMIAYFKVAEIEPTLLNTMLVYSNSADLNNGTQDIPSQTTFVVGQSYTVEQHIENMIINSDNNSAAVLLAHLDPAIFNNTLVDLGIKILSSDNSDLHDFITAKSYANIFRGLYNASYLNRGYSEKTLDILSKVAFKGIAAPLPASVTVAHKFGEREVDKPDGSVQTRELHDCGIVYKGADPYSLCVMTEGKTFEDMQTAIEDISKVVYDKI